MALGAMLAGASCGDGGSAPVKQSINRIPIPDNPFKPHELETTIGNLIMALDKAEPQQLQLSVVLKYLSGYWEPVRTGTSRAFGELAVNGVVSAPTDDTEAERTARQIQILENQRMSGYKGFGIAPNEAPVADQINAAVDSGIPVITIDSDLPDSKRQLYVGTLNAEAGKTAAQTLLGMMTTTPSGTVVLLGHDTADDWPDGYQRTMGAKTTLEAAGYTVIIRRATWTPDGPAMDTDAMTAALQTASPPPVGMIGLFSNAFLCGDAAIAAGLTAADVKIVGFDFEAGTLAHMQNGVIQATHVQRQYYMGYFLPYLLYSINVLGLDKTKTIIAPQMVDDSRFNTGLDVVRADQLDQYNAYLDTLGIGG
jgi:ribose transport system substrate-binding protein